MEAARDGLVLDQNKSDTQIEEAPTVAQEIQIPPCPEGFESLLGFFFTCGQVIKTGQGIVPLTGQEIQAWIDILEEDMTRWEIITVKKMSEAYVSQYYSSDDPLCSAPYHAAVVDKEENRKMVVKKVEDFFNSLTKVKVIKESE